MANFAERLVFTPSELSRMTPIHVDTWQKWCREGRVRASKPFGRFLIPRAELDRILAGSTVAELALAGRKP